MPNLSTEWFNNQGITVTTDHEPNVEISIDVPYETSEAIQVLELDEAERLAKYLLEVVARKRGTAS
jgi:hypothetical protein